jgi:glutathione S-transferase
MDVYFDMMSQPSRAILCLLDLNNVAYNKRLTQIFKLEHKSEEFLKINPLGQVPAMVDNGFALYGSQAIATYICISRNLPDHWYPADLQKRSQMDAWLHAFHTGLRMGAPMVFENVLKP